MKRVAEAFRDARNAIGKTQTEVAQIVGCTQGFIAQIEAGDRPLPLLMVPSLPDEIRGPVIDAAQAELMEQADKLEAMR